MRCYVQRENVNNDLLSLGPWQDKAISCQSRENERGKEREKEREGEGERERG